MLHSTRLGPAAGGCRLWRYPDAASAATDALRLAEGMAYTNALADLPLGGGKAVIRLPDGPFDRAALFRAFGREVERLAGRYLTAEDVGTGVGDMQWVRAATRHVGSHLCALLAEAGARLVVTDIDPARGMAVADRLGAQFVAPDAILDVPCEVFAPCALGGVIDDHGAARIKAGIVCAAAHGLAPHRAADALARGCIAGARAPRADAA